MRTVQLGATSHFYFTTRNSSGVPTQLAGTPAVEVYEDGSTTQITAGETLTVDFDTVTGLNHLSIAHTSANGYENGKVYHAVISTGTVGGSSVVGEVVGSFAVESLAAEAARELQEAMFPDYVVATVTGNTTTAINLSDILDASALADHVINEVLAIKYVGGTYDGLIVLAMVTDYAVTNQLATVQQLGTEAALPEALAAGDMIWRVGHGQVNNITTQEDGSGLTEAGGDGDHLTALPTDADLMPVANEAFTYQFHMVNANGAPTAGLTITAERILDGAAKATCTGTVTDEGDGVYSFAASAADMNGAAVTHLFSASGAITNPIHWITTSGV